MDVITKDANDGKVVVSDGHKSKEYASKGVAGAGLGLGIAGTALWLLNAFNDNSGLFGRTASTQVGAVEVGGLGTSIANSIMGTINARKECADVLALTNKMWQNAYDEQKQRFDDRSVLNGEFFSLYSYTNKGFADAEQKRVNDSFALYKNARDSKDELLGQINDLKSEIAVMKATRPYQDKIIQMCIDNAAQVADFNLYRRTYRMITGELVLPSTPTVTGYPSYNVCSCNQPAATTPTGA